MLRAILNKSWRQHPTRHQLYGHPPPITKTIQVRRTRYVEHCWRSKDELIRDVLLWTPAYGQAKAGRPARTYIQQRWWMIGRCGERGSGISVLAARHDDDDEQYLKPFYCPQTNERWFVEVSVVFDLFESSHESFNFWIDRIHKGVLLFFRILSSYCIHLPKNEWWNDKTSFIPSYKKEEEKQVGG